MPGTVIKLYACYKCEAVMDESDTERAEAPCKCGSRMVRPAPPTKKNIVKYILRKPKVILLWVKENVFRRHS